jgi:hypothetical protein
MLQQIDRRSRSHAFHAFGGTLTRDQSSIALHRQNKELTKVVGLILCKRSLTSPLNPCTLE